MAPSPLSAVPPVSVLLAAFLLAGLRRRLAGRPPTGLAVPSGGAHRPHTARAAGAPTGSRLIAQLASLSVRERDRVLLRQILAGNIPTFLRRLQPVEMSLAADCAASERVVIWVMPDYLASARTRTTSVSPWVSGRRSPWPGASASCSDLEDGRRDLHSRRAQALPGAMPPVRACPRWPTSWPTTGPSSASSSVSGRDPGLGDKRPGPQPRLAERPTGSPSTAGTVPTARRSSR